MAEPVQDHLGDYPERADWPTTIKEPTMSQEPGFVPVGDVCSRHEALVRDIGALTQATTHFRDSLIQHKHEMDSVTRDVNKALTQLIRTNGLTGERLAGVEVKVGWLAGILGMVGGAVVNLAVWLFRLH